MRFLSAAAAIIWNLGSGSCSVATCGAADDAACTNKDDCEAEDVDGKTDCGDGGDEQCRGVWTSQWSGTKCRE